MPRNNHAPKKPESYFAHHGLVQLYKRRALPAFRKERSSITCPTCGAMLYLYIHKASNWRAFVMCHQCAYFVKGYLFNEILERIDREQRTSTTSKIIHNTLDRLYTRLGRSDNS